MRTLSRISDCWQTMAIVSSASVIVLCVACGDAEVTTLSADSSGGAGGTSSSSSTVPGQGGASTTTASSSTAAVSSSVATTGAGGSGGRSDPFAPDPTAAISLDVGDVSGCLPGLLTAGDAGAYAGFAGSSDGAYFVWRQEWEDSALDMRIETWDAFGGITEPGTYTLTEADTNYVDCAVCIFASSVDFGEFWPQPGDTVTFTSLSTGPVGVDQPLVGTFEGTLSDGLCSAEVVISFSANARDMKFGPL